MFDQLTPGELENLAEKLSRAGHVFYGKADSIANTAFYMADTGRIEVGSDAWKGLWNAREPLVDLAGEMHALMGEVDATAAARNA